jgi:hypothetical protein
MESGRKVTYTEAEARRWLILQADIAVDDKDWRDVRKVRDAWDKLVAERDAAVTKLDSLQRSAGEMHGIISDVVAVLNGSAPSANDYPHDSIATAQAVVAERDRYHEALTIIARKEGRYSRDRYEHACNVIEAMAAVADVALARPGATDG